MAKMEEASVNATTERPTKAGILNRPRSSMGSAVCSSLTKNATMRTADADEQPDDGRTAPAEVVAAHEREHEHEQAGRERDEADPVDAARRCGSFDSAILANVMTTATTPMGTLTKKIQRQPMPLVMAPPIEGPDRHGAADHRAVDAEGGPAVPAHERARR